MANLTIPASYDQDFIIEKAALVSGYGFSPPVNGIVTINFYGDGYNRTLTVVEGYPTAYLEKALPAKLAAISAERDRRIRNFTFNGFVLDLEGDTKRDLADAALGLTRNTDVLSIEWSLGGGKFTTLTRDELLAIADAAFKHVQTTFAGHRKLADRAKAALNIDELALVNENDPLQW